MSIVDRMFVNALSFLQSRKSEEGQGLAEYALILALIAILCLTALTAVKTGIVGTLNNVANAL